MRWIAAFFSTLSMLCAQTAVPEKPHLFIRVALGTASPEPVSGRLLVFIAPGKGAKEVNMDLSKPAEVYVAGKEMLNWQPGTAVEVDADDATFPGPLSAAKPGDYQMQAVLDVGHTYNYSGRDAGDLVSEVETVNGFDQAHGIVQTLTLSHMTEKQAKPRDQHLQENIEPFSFTSKVLTNFWGRDVVMRGYVVTPPNYKNRPREKFPTVYFTHGFGGNFARLEPQAETFYNRMASKQFPDMIWVVLDESCPTGTHEFADSVNNGPWGQALTTELIPHLETTYRMDAKATGRFLQGHSSGGWATLWLQTRYPKIFGGTWSTSPDSSDFHDFTGPDLYADHANLYRKPDGSLYPIMRAKGEVLATMEQFAKLERALGAYGGQMSSFDWVFSPRGLDGRPLPMFNRDTGDVDPNVLAYWRDHYDIAHLVATNWQTIGPDLRGKIHVFVGTADTFYLDGPAHRLQAVLDSLHADAHFTYIPDRSHFDLYAVPGDGSGLFIQIAKEMYAVARPKAVKN